jgi:two-component system chemotaxis sensor kinase CheA
MVESGEAVVAIPLDSVRRTLRVSDHEIALAGARQFISFEGHAVPFLPLSEALRHQSSSGSRRQSWSCVLLSSGSEVAAIGVDRLLGTGTVLVRSLAPLVAVDRVVAGASLDAEGNPQLVLDPEGLMEAAHRTGAPAPAPPKAVRQPILVIDDSLTTRMVEQSILESAGHVVELATSAEEALEKAHARRYGLFLVDVEMPGMNGFDFIARTQEDPLLREIPSILVTSRNSADDKRRGQAAGSRAYIVKSEFNQEYLLQTIEQLMN